MDGPLVDAEGFPRSDIDLYAVRTARNRVICKQLLFLLSFFFLIHAHHGSRPACTILGLRNDHKIVMEAVEKKIHDIHAEAREAGKVTNEQTARQSGAPVPKAFAKINSVTDGSPAAVAVSLSICPLLLYSWVLCVCGCVCKLGLAGWRRHC